MIQNNLTAEFIQLISERHSKRAYLPQPVPPEITREVLRAAANAPSSKNTQPWQVAVVSGTKQQTLSQIICEKFDAGIAEEPDYIYTPDPWPPEFKERARACGFALFALKGIERQDYIKRKAHDRENFTFFGAPLTLIFHLPAGAQRGNFLDLGCFMQNVMLGYLAHGLGTCPQFSLTSYSQTIREFLSLEGRWIVSGMSVGYPDPQAKVNQFVPERLPLDDFVQWFDS